MRVASLALLAALAAAPLPASAGDQIAVLHPKPTLQTVKLWPAPIKALLDRVAGICRELDVGGLVIGEGVRQVDLNGDGRPDYIGAECDLSCSQSIAATWSNGWRCPAGSVVALSEGPFAYRGHALPYISRVLSVASGKEPARLVVGIRECPPTGCTTRVFVYRLDGGRFVPERECRDWGC